MNLNEIFANKNSNISKDLKLNLNRYLTQSSLDEKSIMLIVYSLAFPLHLPSAFASYAKERLSALEFTADQIQEAQEIGAFVKMLNTYYKFKNFVNNNTDYNMAGLRMNAMAKPNLTKVEFETLALAHSIINSCEFCVKAHEHELRTLGLTADNVHDIARLVSVLGAMGLLQD